MTRQFAKWAAKQRIQVPELAAALSEVQAGVVEANLGGHLFKKRIRFEGKGKSGSGCSIICYKLAKILLSLPKDSIAVAVESGDFIEVKK